MKVRVWLRGLGLGRYEEKFRENKINFDVLADLTDGDLKELGVSLGDVWRRQDRRDRVGTATGFAPFGMGGGGGV